LAHLSIARAESELSKLVLRQWAHRVGIGRVIGAQELHPATGGGHTFYRFG
jgi:hypothetical protein